MARFCPIRSWLSLPLLAAAGLFVGCTPPDSPSGNDSPPEREAAVELKVVGMKELDGAIESHKGKIVVLDVWATWCRSCRKEFPHLVELHQKHRGDVVCMSVSVDDEPDRDRALGFLREKGAAFPNFLLDEDAAVWQERWLTKGVPVVFVYGRDGKLARKFDNDDPDNQFTYADVNRLVDGLLAGSK